VASGVDHERGLFEHLTCHGLLVRLARLDVAAGQRPEPAAGSVGSAHEQEAFSVIGHHRTDATDDPDA